MASKHTKPREFVDCSDCSKDNKQCEKGNQYHNVFKSYGIVALPYPVAETPDARNCAFFVG